MQITQYTSLPIKKAWLIIGLLSLICVKNINSSDKGCPPIFEVLEYELKIQSSVIDKVCQSEYLDDDSSTGNMDDYGDDYSGTNTNLKSLCSFECDYYIEYCPVLSEKIHNILVYNYDDFRWKYNEILSVCKNWDELFYTEEPSSTTTDTTTTGTTTDTTTTGTTTDTTTTGTTTYTTTTGTTTGTTTTGTTTDTTTTGTTTDTTTTGTTTDTTTTGTTTGTTTTGTTTDTTTTGTTTYTTTTGTTTDTTTDTTTTEAKTQNQYNLDNQYSKGWSIGIVTVMSVLLSIVAGVSIFLCNNKTKFKAHH
jgi:hypothetical protein